MRQGGFRVKRGLEQERRPGEVARAVARAKQGDSQAVRFLYLRYAGNVYGYARSLVRNDHDAEDIVQQVFTRMLTAIRDYEQRSQPFSAWLLRITYNLSIDHLRRRRRITAYPEAFDGPEAAVNESNELCCTLRDALAELPARQREIMVLRHIAGFSPGEIAEYTGRSVDAVHGLHHRARLATQAALRHADAAPVTLAA
jgi:RNA polymerase sigma-70 factor (ECF subfamily)